MAHVDTHPRARRLPLDPSLIIVVRLLAGVVIAGFSLSDRFGTLRSFTNVLEQAAALGFASRGQAIVVIVGGIDLSIGAIVTASTVLMVSVVDLHPALMIPMIFGTLAFGALIGFVTIKTGVHPLIVTLGTASILNGAVLIFTLQPTGGVPFWFEDFAYGRIGGVMPISGLVMLLCFALAWGFLRYTPTGCAFYAVGAVPRLRG
ncbi:MAG: ABC transporter permease [Pseudomonadota bacterium]